MPEQPYPVERGPKPDVTPVTPNKDNKKPFPFPADEEIDVPRMPGRPKWGPDTREPSDIPPRERN